MPRMSGMHRLQLSIDDARLERVAEVASLRGTSLAAVIRDAIDIAFARDGERAAAAARRVLADQLLADTERILRW
jgi:hypothetical protein